MGKRISFYFYNSKLKTVARELRKNQTREEMLFWKLFVKPTGLRVLRQKPLGEFIVDFYIPSLKLAIEIDGEIHDYQKDRDAERDQKLNDLGIRVLRFKNKDIIDNYKYTYIYFNKYLSEIGSENSKK